MPGYRNVAAPIRMSDSDMRIRGRGPGHGEHTRDVLLDAGYSADEIDRLVGARVVAEHGPDSPGGPATPRP